jgi:hypothetical protein
MYPIVHLRIVMLKYFIFFLVLSENTFKLIVQFSEVHVMMFP